MVKMCVVAIGQLPPPVNGLTYITEQTIKSARCSITDLYINDISARHGLFGVSKHISRLISTTKACGSIIFNLKFHRRLCYIACEGGLGLFYILALVFFAKITGYKILLHHHSFAYINYYNKLMNAIIKIGGNQLVHVFLGKKMEDEFQLRYISQRICSIILSNAAFVPPSKAGEIAADGPLVLGHLSNLTKDKGLHIFIDLIRAAVSSGDPVRGILAGKAENLEDQALIEHAMQDLAEHFEYRGPLYGADKDAFYRDIDVFVFPTQYLHEAQPTVLFEAQAAGCKIVSFDRGCIAEQVQMDGFVVQQDQEFVSECREWLRSNAHTLRLDRQQTYARYVERYKKAHHFSKVLFIEGWLAGKKKTANNLSYS